MTRFIPIGATQDAVQWLMKERRQSLTLVSRHGLGDNIFFSPCFEYLAPTFERLFFCSSVNAYSTIFHESRLVTPVYSGGTNGNDLGLMSAERFTEQFDRHRLDLGVEESFVYHFGLFDPAVPYSDPRAFVKGRRNIVELELPAPPPSEVPRYHVAPDLSSKAMVGAVLKRWLPERELIIVARYGHTDVNKNFGHDQKDTLELVDRLEQAFPGRFKCLSFDYIPGGHTADGHRANIRSVYGFLPCDSAAMYHAMAHARLLVTVPTGPMLVGATIPELRMLTLWKAFKPYHFLDPQHSGRVWAIVEDPQEASTDFMCDWAEEDRAAVTSRWNIIHAPVTPEVVATAATRILEGED